MGGVALRNWQNINIMMRWGQVAVFSISSDGMKPQSDRLPGVKIWHNYDIGSLRQQRSLIRKIRDRLWWLQPYSHPWVNQLYGDSAVRDLKEVLTEFQPQIVVFEELWLYRYFKVVQHYGCRTIYDAHNVEVLLRRDINSLIQKPKWHSGIESRLFLHQVESIERNFIHQADQIWACSDDDARLLEKLYRPRRSARVIPNGVNVAEYNNLCQGEGELPDGLEPLRWTLIFTALFTHPPNAIAAQLLIDQIYPQLREYYPNCRLILAGRNPTPTMRQAAKKDPKIIVTGQVPDVRPYLAAASVVIVPLLDGGGTRLKILEAFAAGRPVVSTAKGAEGLHVRDGENLLIRDSVEEMVMGVCQLWSDPALAKKLTDAARKLVCAEYSWQGVSKRVDEAVRGLLGR
ncbi:MAG TPA: glycosyl transferase family 1 [Cyanobacteria bacterium UBA8803]|nr:glycosyl transferase family 1 [Cyanobacteria bacterium UBA9273]HBL62481.1 glycosyl transferase family 1 [Cyanobacteria bacterium UBA8803]